jgi:hypothetical protein
VIRALGVQFNIFVAVALTAVLHPQPHNPIMSNRKDTTKMPLKSALKTGSKGSVSLPTSAAGLKTKNKAAGKPSKGKGKAVEEVEEEEDAFEGESNASGFSGGEEDLDDLEEKDEFDLEEMEVDGEAEGQDDEETDTEDEIDAMYDSKKKSKMNTSEFSRFPFV